jgi:hypothetical protein
MGHDALLSGGRTRLCPNCRAPYVTVAVNSNDGAAAATAGESVTAH